MQTGKFPESFFFLAFLPCLHVWICTLNPASLRWSTQGRTAAKIGWRRLAADKRKCHPAVYWSRGSWEALTFCVCILTDNHWTWELNPAWLHSKDRSAGVGTRSLRLPHIYSSVWFVVFCTGNSGRSHSSTYFKLHIMFKNQSFSPKLLT